MKEFDLDAAKAGKKVMTRDGCKARIVCFDRNDPEKPLVVLRVNRNGKEEAICYPPNGMCSDSVTKYDLVMAPEKNVYYVNIYENYDARLIYKQLFETYEEAYRYAMSHLSEDPKINYITTTKLEWEE